MSLTPQQEADLAADVGQDPKYDGMPQNSDTAFLIASDYNQPASPEFVVWRTSISADEINEACDWSEVVALTVNEMLAFDLLKGQGSINPSKTSIRAAFSAIFPSNQQPNTNAALTAVAKRAATRAEALLATGAGSAASPGLLTFQGNLSYQDVMKAMGW